MIGEKDVIDIGFLGKPHGYKGEINAELDYDGGLFDDRRTPFIFNIDGIYVPFFIESIRKKGDDYLVKFEGLDSDKDASLLSHGEIYITRKDFTELTGVSSEEIGEDEIIIDGALVMESGSNKLLGKVLELEEGVEYDYLLVEPAEGGEEFRIPFIEPFIVSVDEDVTDGTAFITVDLPEGMLNLN